MCQLYTNLSFLLYVPAAVSLTYILFQLFYIDVCIYEMLAAVFLVKQ